MTNETEPREVSPVVEVLARCLEGALQAMNDAVALTAEKGPAVGMELIADYLNDTDAVDDELVAITPEDWLTRWSVNRAGDDDGR